MRRYHFFALAIIPFLAACASEQRVIPACPEWPEDCETYDGFVSYGENDTVVETHSPNSETPSESHGEAPTGPVDNPATQTPETPSEPPSEPPRESQGHSHGNASGNNGKGGNYEHTGHEDNGKGNGKGRRE